MTTAGIKLFQQVFELLTLAVVANSERKLNDRTTLSSPGNALASSQW